MVGWLVGWLVGDSEHVDGADVVDADGQHGSSWSW